MGGARVYTGIARIFLALFVFATLALDLQAEPIRLASGEQHAFVPSGSGTEGNLNLLGSAVRYAEEQEEELDEDDFLLLSAAFCGCRASKTAIAVTVASVAPRQRSSGQFATGPPIL